jgi:hypothetical protein
LRGFFKKRTKTAKVREIIIICLTVISIIDKSLTFARVYPRALAAPYIKVIILLLFIRSLREVWKRIFLVVYDSFDIILILFAYLILFSYLGFILFENVEDGGGFYFNTF